MCSWSFEPLYSVYRKKMGKEKKLALCVEGDLRRHVAPVTIRSLWKGSQKHPNIKI